MRGDRWAGSEGAGPGGMGTGENLCWEDGRPGKRRGCGEGLGLRRGVPAKPEGRRHPRPSAVAGAPSRFVPGRAVSKLGGKRLGGGSRPRPREGSPGGPGRALRRRSGRAPASAGRLGAPGRAGRSAGRALSPAAGPCRLYRLVGRFPPAPRRRDSSLPPRAPRRRCRG